MTKTQFTLNIIFVLLFTITINAQTAPPSNLSDVALRNWLKTNWYDGSYTQLNYSPARTAMYTTIDEVNGNVFCVYSNYEDDINTVTYPNPINTEHTVPQSFFSQNETMRGDIHHLFPTYGPWNSIRSSYKLGEIPDNLTTDWMREAINNDVSIPISNIDEYSEYINAANTADRRFEPREDHKGDAARAIFYFFTMYEDHSSLSRIITDVADIETLCNWHTIDPVSTKEDDRNEAIKVAQGNWNPFVSLSRDVAYKAFGCNTLPIRLKYFIGENEENENVLRWESFLEQDIDYFEIEQSTNGQDFDFLTTLQPKGQNELYSFTDNDVQSSKYYRLNTFEFSGEQITSKVIFIAKENDVKINATRINASQWEIYVNTDSNSNGTMNAFTIDGRLLKSSTLNYQKGNNLIEYKKSNNIELIQLEINGKSYTIKLI